MRPFHTLNLRGLIDSKNQLFVGDFVETEADAYGHGVYTIQSIFDKFHGKAVRVVIIEEIPWMEGSE